jgi:hypothetical protein
MGTTGLVYSRQFDEKLNEYIKQRIDVFACNIARHVYYEQPTHAHIDSFVSDGTVELEFHADSSKDRRIRRVETNHIRYCPETAPRMRAPRLETAKNLVMEYGIPIDTEQPRGNTVYFNPGALETTDIDKELLSQIFTGSCIMPAVGSEIPAVLKKEKWCGYDLPGIARAYGYSTPESVLEKIRTFYARLLRQDASNF